jgi:Asp-tRNA(Asn)/Glu-tRNA(Gln) amidotransferase A subunit family amidase
MAQKLNELGFAQISFQIRTGLVTSEAIMLACIDRIKQREAEVGAFVSYDANAALALARLADQSEAKGPLHGVPFAIKDIIDTNMFPTGWGTTFYDGHQPSSNASCVEMFIRAGAIPFGKTVTTELAYFKPGKTANPHNLSHKPGGSSSGSAAVVADNMLPFGFGSQTAASLISPAAYCGVAGYKASHGSFDLQGVMSLSPSLDTLGFLAREIEDIELARSVLCGSTPVKSIDLEAAPLRISLFRGPHWHDGSLEMRDVCSRTMNELKIAGAQTGELVCPEVFKLLTEAQKTVMAYEVAHARIYEYNRYKDPLSLQFKQLVESGLAVSRSDFESACTTRDRAARILETMLIDTDIILTPAAPGEAPLGLDATGDPLFSRGWNFLKVRCISIPYGKGPNGLPLSVQLVAQMGVDDDLLAAAKWVDRQLNYLDN